MIRLMIATLTAVTLLAVATTALWSRSHASHSGQSAKSAGMMSLPDLHKAAGVEKLVTQDIDDQSLVYSTPAPR